MSNDRLCDAFCLILWCYTILTSPFISTLLLLLQNPQRQKPTHKLKTQPRPLQIRPRSTDIMQQTHTKPRLIGELPLGKRESVVPDREAVVVYPPGVVVGWCGQVGQGVFVDAGCEGGMGDWEGGEEGGVCWVVGWGGCRIEESCRGGRDGGEAVYGYWVCHVGLNWILESDGGGDSGRIRVI